MFLLVGRRPDLGEGDRKRRFHHHLRRYRRKSCPVQFSSGLSIPWLIRQTNTAMFNGILTFHAVCINVSFDHRAGCLHAAGNPKIPVQYTSSSSDQGPPTDMTYLPLKINSASVIPVIFASAIMTAPLTIMSFFEANSFTTTLNNILSLQNAVGPLHLCGTDRSVYLLLH